MDSSVQINGSIIHNPFHSTDRLSSRHSSPDTRVKQEAPPPPEPEKNAVAHIRIPLHQKQCSARDQVIEIEWPVESAKELLLLLQGLIK